jgi:hypothetical protein
MKIGLRTSMLVGIEEGLDRLGCKFWYYFLLEKIGQTTLKKRPHPSVTITMRLAFIKHHFVFKIV